MTTFQSSRPTDDETRRFLLGELSLVQRERLEERALFDDGAFDALVTAEDELIDEHGRGELSTAAAAAFEARSAEVESWTQRSSFARALARRADAAAGAAVPGAPTWRRWAAAAAVTLLAGSSGWFAWQLDREADRARELQLAQQSLAAQVESLDRQVEAERRTAADLAERLEARNRELRRETEAAAEWRQRAQSAATTTVSFVLSLDVLRGSEAVRARRLPADAQWVQLQLDLEGDSAYAGFRVEIRDQRGREVWSEDSLAATTLAWGEAVDLRVPAAILEPGRYEVSLVGVDATGELRDVGFYDLTIERP